MDDPAFYYRGKPLESYSKEELIDILIDCVNKMEADQIQRQHERYVLSGMAQVRR